MDKNSLQRQQLNNKIVGLAKLKEFAMPPTGWIKAIRTAIGMSMLQLGNKLSVSKQGIQDMEKREKEGAITIKSLKEIARVLDMQLVYGFVPNDGSLDALIDRKAKEMAIQIVMRASNTMKLENQGNSDKRIHKAIEERTEAIKRDMPKILWD